ncbi:MAG: DUF1588 domain-containing protein [Myxococcota bacterium]
MTSDRARGGARLLWRVGALAAAGAMTLGGCRQDGAAGDRGGSGSSGGFDDAAGSSASESGDPTGSEEPSLPGTDDCRPPTARLWALSPLQIERSVAAVLPGQIPHALEQALTPYVSSGVVYDDDPRLLNASPQFMAELVHQLGVAVDDALAADPSGIVGCLPAPEAGDLADVDDACVHQIATDWAATVYRRSLGASESEALEDFYAEQRAATGPEQALRLLLRRILAAPPALYRSAQGDSTFDDEGFVVLTAAELADIVSYTLTDSPPDETLRAVAADDSLRDPAVLREHVERLLGSPPSDVVEGTTGDPREIVGLMRMFEEWLDIDEIRFQSGKERTLRWLANEPLMFLVHVLYEDAGDLKTVLAADYTAWSNTLSDFYEREEKLEGGTIAPTLHDRRGVLMQGGFLTAHGGTTARGLFIRERLLCQSIVAPDDVDMNLPGLEQQLEQEEGVDLPPREVRERHLEDPACSSCHRQIDPLGFPLDGFGEDGRVRTELGGFPIDTQGEIVGTTASDGVVQGPTELVEVLADSPDVRACFVRQVYAFAHGRPVQQSDACYLESLEQRFEDTGGDIRDLMVTIMTDDSMRLRTPALVGAGDGDDDDGE